MPQAKHINPVGDPQEDLLRQLRRHGLCEEIPTGNGSLQYRCSFFSALAFNREVDRSRFYLKCFGRDVEMLGRSQLEFYEQGIARLIG